MTHRKMAQDCWRLIKGMVDSVDESDLALFNELDDAAINVIEMACDSAAESQRIADGHPPKGSLPSFTCPRCGRTSYNPHDIRERYCGACHSFR
jgi:hypothetical protein